MGNLCIKTYHYYRKLLSTIILDLFNFFKSLEIPDDVVRDYVAKCKEKYISLKILLTLDDSRLEKLNIRMGHRIAILKKSNLVSNPVELANEVSVKMMY